MEKVCYLFACSWAFKLLKAELSLLIDKSKSCQVLTAVSALAGRRKREGQWNSGLLGLCIPLTVSLSF